MDIRVSFNTLLNFPLILKFQKLPIRLPISSLKKKKRHLFSTIGIKYDGKIAVDQAEQGYQAFPYSKETQGPAQGIMLCSRSRSKVITSQKVFSVDQGGRRAYCSHSRELLRTCLRKQLNLPLSGHVEAVPGNSLL